MKFLTETNYKMPYKQLMKPTFLFTAIIIILLGNNSMAQTTTLTIKEHKKISKAGNDIFPLVEKGNIKKAVQNTVFVAKPMPALIDMQVHSNFSQWIWRKDKRLPNLERYFQQLRDLKNPLIDSIIMPIQWFSFIHITNDSAIEEIYTDSLLQFSKAGMHFASHNERYMLGAANVMRKKHGQQDTNAQKLFDAAFNNLQTFMKNDTLSLNSRPYYTQRSSIRNMLAYCYYTLANQEKDPKKQLQLYTKCMEYIPDQTDLTQGGGSTFYDNLFLVGKNTSNPGFENNYYQLLKNKNEWNTLLIAMTRQTLNQPTTKKIQSLRHLYDSLHTNNSFTAYWKKKVLENLTPQKNVDPPLLENQQSDWVLIDFWGTWCKPCVEDLPKVQKLFNTLTPNGSIALQTYSYNSRGLEGFMQKNKYNFPVIEVDDSFIAAHNIQGFPTKLLVHRSGGYYILSLSNWEEELEMLTLLHAAK
jgi:thiol-disulfide isomerase/thioredoxin